jgi:hypothetical protein
MRTSRGSSGSGSVRLLEHSVAPNDETWIAVGSRASMRASASGIAMFWTIRSASRSATVKRGWSSTWSQIVSKAGYASVIRSPTSVSSA